MSTTEFPTEATEREIASPFLDTDAMLAELNDLANVGDEGGAETEPVPGASGTEGEVVLTTAPAPEGETEGGEVVTPPSAPALSVPPGFIEFEGQMWPVDEVRALLELNRRMKEQPELAQKVTAAITPAPEAEQRPSWVDEDDPRSVAMWADMQRIEREAKANAQRVEQFTERDRRAHVVDSFRAAISSFKGQHPNLSDEQVAQVADLAGKSGIIDGLERTEGSLSAAFEKGMEMTLWSQPTLRSLILAEQSTTVPPNGKDRKAKQAALNSGGGSRQRGAGAAPEKPRTREEMMAAALNDMRASMQD